MAIRFNCPSCQRVLRVDDQFAGKRSKCPGCSNPVTVPAGANGGGNFDFATQPAAGQWMPPAPSAPALRDDWDQLGGEGGGEGRPLARGWLGVRGGLKLVRMAMIIRLCTMFLVIAVVGVLFLTSAAVVLAAFDQIIKQQMGGGRGGPGPGGFSTFIQADPDGFGDPSGNAAAAAGAGILIGMVCFGLTVGTMMLIAYILEVIGYAKWLSVPPNAGGYGLAMTTLLCALFPILVMLVSCGVAFLPPKVGGVIGQLMNLANLAASLTGFICGLLFIRQVGVALNDMPTRSAVLSYVIWFVVSLVTMFLSVCIVVGGMIAFMGVAFDTAQSGGSSSGLGAMGLVGAVAVGVVVLINVILGIVVLVKYFGMLNTAIRAIDMCASTA